MTVPLVRSLTYDNSSQVTAADLSAPMGAAPFAAVVTGITMIPAASASAPSSIANSRAYTVFNRGGGAGTGTTILGTFALTTTVGLQDNVAVSFGLGTTPNLTLAAGDVLEFESLHRTTGMLDPGGRVTVTFSRI